MQARRRRTVVLQALGLMTLGAAWHAHASPAAMQATAVAKVASPSAGADASAAPQVTGKTVEGEVKSKTESKA